MNYPIEILPSPSYKIIDCDVDNFYLVRKTDAQSKEELKGLMSSVKSKYITPSKDIADLSTSLLSIFHENHYSLELTEEGASIYNIRWSLRKLVQPPLYKRHFISTSTPVCWYIKIGDIDSDFPYEHNNETITVESNVEHDPYDWNFWHYSLNWEIDGHRINRDEMKKWELKLCRFIINVFIKSRATVDRPENIPALTTECYFDQAINSNHLY